MTHHDAPGGETIPPDGEDTLPPEVLDRDALDASRAQELSTLLDRVRRSAAELLATLDHPPHAIRVRAGQAAIDIEWHEPSAASRPADRDGHADPAVTPDRDPAWRVVTAQVVGVFYRAPEPGAPPFVREGDVVDVGQQIAIIEAMKLMIPVETDAGGRVVEVLKADGAPVEYGEPLFTLTAAGAA
jgi:acetyl-CoA carboxylase biotin carboxyl carrier protein